VRTIAARYVVRSALARPPQFGDSLAAGGNGAQPLKVFAAHSASFIGLTPSFWAVPAMSAL
jgi:hypothetical protein